VTYQVVSRAVTEEMKEIFRHEGSPAHRHVDA
jgi:hypothetical protein